MLCHSRVTACMSIRSHYFLVTTGFTIGYGTTLTRSSGCSIIIVRWRIIYPTPQQSLYNRILSRLGASIQAHQQTKNDKATQQSTYNTPLTTSLKIVPLGISIFSTPACPSARVGPTFNRRTGFFRSTACFKSLHVESLSRSYDHSYEVQGKRNT